MLVGRGASGQIRVLDLVSAQAGTANKASVIGLRVNSTWRYSVSRV
jgi:hypothetical protein